MVRTMTVELLEGAPADDILRPVRLAVEQIRAEHGLDPTTSRVGKVGSKLYVEVTFVAAPGHWDITDEHRDRPPATGADTVARWRSSRTSTIPPTRRP